MQSSGEVWRHHSPEGTGSIWDSGAGAGIRTGVSISRKFWSRKNRRIAWMMADLSLKVSILSDNFQSSSTPLPQIKKSSSFDACQILSAAGIDPDLFPLFDERGHLKLVSSLNGDRFGIPRYGIPLGPGIGLGHRDIDEIGQADPQWPVFEQEDLHLNVVQKEILRIADLILGKKDLFVTLVVHEAVFSFLLIEVLHLFFLQVSRIEDINGAKRPLELVSIYHILQLAAIERLSLPRLDKVEFRNDI